MFIGLKVRFSMNFHKNTFRVIANKSKSIATNY